MKKLLLAAAAGLMLINAQFVEAAPIDAGAQMNRLNEYIERERIARQIEENRAKKAAKVEGAEISQATAPQGAEVKLKLNNVVTDASTVLKDEEIKAITKDYIGKDVSVKDLYGMLERINALYQKKGYITCRAFLLQQTIENGVVKVTLVEGKTGDVEVKNNKWTRAKYIKKRVSLANGEVANINELNEDILRFNATNDVQLRIAVKAGQKPGTTDYVITAYEPQQFNWTIMADNAGSKSNGEVRGGVFFTAKSLTGTRDALTLGNVDSKGSKAVTTSYSHTLGRSGTKLNVGYNTNSVKTIKGAFKDMVKGHSNSVSLGVTQPWVINEKTRSEAILELNNQKSSTDFRVGGGAFRIVEDRMKDASLGFAMTNYGNSHVFYQKHMLSFGKCDNVRDESESYGLYKGNGFYQKAYNHGQSISTRLEAQWSTKDNVPSSRQFYIGGMNSVRGYEENFRGADKGVNLSIEYGVPLNKKRNISAFTFLDYGRLFGEDAQSTNANRFLASTGLGIKASINKNIFANLSLGVPLKKHFDDGQGDASSARLHFTLTGQM